jgi:hypothetical protein
MHMTTRCLRWLKIGLPKRIALAACCCGKHSGRSPYGSSYQPQQPPHMDTQHQHAPWAPAGTLSVTVSNLPLEADQHEVASAFRRAINVQVRDVSIKRSGLVLVFTW